MISRTIDKLTSEHPAFAEYSRSRIEYFFDTSAGRNIAVCFVSGIAAGIFAGGTGEVIKWTALIIAAVVWIQASILAGFLKQWIFVVFSAVYFTVPYVFILLPGTAEYVQATDLQLTLSDLMQAVPLRPMMMFAGENDPQMLSVGCFAAVLVLFLAGAYIRGRAKSSDFYCRTRLEQIEE